MADTPATTDSRTTDALTIFDLSIGERRAATQHDIDEMQKFIVGISTISVQDERQPSEAFGFRLACYANPMRSDGLFVAEDKPIEPYQGITNLDGSLCYPAVPITRYSLRSQLDPDFARELVKRWNAHV